MGEEKTQDIMELIGKASSLLTKPLRSAAGKAQWDEKQHMNINRTMPTATNQNRLLRKETSLWLVFFLEQLRS